MSKRERLRRAKKKYSVYPIGGDGRKKKRAMGLAPKKGPTMGLVTHVGIRKGLDLNNKEQEITGHQAAPVTGRTDLIYTRQHQDGAHRQPGRAQVGPGHKAATRRDLKREESSGSRRTKARRVDPKSAVQGRQKTTTAKSERERAEREQVDAMVDRTVGLHGGALGSTDGQRA
jgi:hypothetical protein